MTQLWNHFDSRDLLLLFPLSRILCFSSHLFYFQNTFIPSDMPASGNTLLPSSRVTAFSITAGVTGYMTYASPIRCLSCVGPILRPEPFPYQTIGVTALLLYTFIN